jgi:DNA-binding NarL/FixJ family response regulator
MVTVPDMPPEPVSVLVVDDHPDVRFLVRMLLEEDDGVVVIGEAGSAADALALLDELDPDVVVLDARMPLVDGFEAAPRILDRRPGQQILLLTAVVDDVIRRRAREAGISACLSKEEFRELPRAVKALMRPGAPEGPGTPAPQ